MKHTIMVLPEAYDHPGSRGRRERGCIVSQKM